MVGHVDGENLTAFFVGEPQERLYLVELVHVLALVEQYLAVGVVDDALLDHGRGDDVVHLLRHHDGLAEVFSHRLVHVAQVFGHVRRGERLPRLFHDELLAHTLEPPHLAYERFHDDDGHHGEEFAVFLDAVDLEDDETLGEQVDVLRRIEQEVVTSAAVVLPERGEEVVDVEVGLLHLDVACLQLLPVGAFHVLVKGVEAGRDAPVSANQLHIGGHGAAQFGGLGLGDFLTLALPQREQQRFDAVLLLHVEDVVVGVERIERDGLLFRVGKVDAVRPARLAPYHLAEPLIGVARVHEHHVRALLIVLSYEVVHEERLAAARGTEHELVAVGDDAALHGQVGDVQMQGLAREAVDHLDAEGRGRAAVVRLFGEEAHRLLGERVKTLLGGEVGAVAGHGRPEERRAVYGVVARHALHARQLAARVVLDVPELLLVIAPCHDVEVRPDRGQPEGACLVEVLLYPVLIDGVAAAVARERLHVFGGFLELLQVLLAVVEEEVLVVDVVAGQQQSNGCSERQAAVGAVGGEPFVADVGAHLGGQVARLGEGEEAQAVVAHPHLARREVDVLQAGVVFGQQGEAPLDDARRVVGADKLLVGEPLQRDEARVVHDALELLRSFQELACRLFVDFFGYNVSAAECGEVTLAAVALPCGLGEIEVAAVLEVRTFIEVPFKAAGKKTHVFLLQVGTVAFPNEPVLLVHHTEVGQHLDGLAPRGMYCLVLLRRDRIEFGQRHREADRQVGIFGDDAPALHGKQRQFVLHRSGFKYVPHCSSFLCVPCV